MCQALGEGNLAVGVRLIINRILSKMADAPGKIRTIVFQEPNQCDIFNSTVSLLRNIGFAEECELLNEIDTVSSHYYSLYK